ARTPSPALAVGENAQRAAAAARHHRFRDDPNGSSEVSRADARLHGSPGINHWQIQTNAVEPQCRRNDGAAPEHGGFRWALIQHIYSACFGNRPHRRGARMVSRGPETHHPIPTPTDARSATKLRQKMLYRMNKSGCA